MNSYVKGQLVRCRGSYTDESGVAVDPTTVTAKVQTPSGTITTYTYPATVVKDSTGHYHVDVSVTTAGLWYYRFESTGMYQAAGEAHFDVSTGVF
jgi:hypothetical protein